MLLVNQNVVAISGSSDAAYFLEFRIGVNRPQPADAA
jgi:hypothetical protein